MSREASLRAPPGSAAAALWAAIGVDLGVVVRNQAPPGVAAAAISGQDQDTLVAPALGLVPLTLYAAVEALAGSLATARRDVV